MIKNITKQFPKPLDVEVYDHYARVDRLMDYTNLLPTETATPLISAADRKDFFFETFPAKWRQEFISTKCQDFYTATVEDIIQFMKQKKRSAKTDDKQRKKTDDKNPNKRSQDEGGQYIGPSGGRGRGRGHYGGCGGGRDRARQSSEVDGNIHCPVHPGCNHKWKNCNKNPDNPNKQGNYREQQQLGGGRYGSQGGRFGGGRGHGGG